METYQINKDLLSDEDKKMYDALIKDKEWTEKRLANINRMLENMAIIQHVGNCINTSTKIRIPIKDGVD